VDGDDLVGCTDGSTALARKGAESIGHRQDIGFGIDNPSFSGNSILTQDQFLSIFIEGLIVVFPISRKPINL
jgi:hypothetical protein